MSVGDGPFTRKTPLIVVGGLLLVGDVARPDLFGGAGSALPMHVISFIRCMIRS